MLQQIQIMEEQEMRICQEIVNAINDSIKPQKAKEATVKIQSFRKIQNYRDNLLFILCQNGVFGQINTLALIIELKNSTVNQELSQQQQAFFKQFFLLGVQKFINQTNHKIFRKIVENITIRNHDNWFNLQYFIKYLNEFAQTKDIYGSCYFISMMIGVTQAYRYKFISGNDNNDLKRYQPLIQIFEQKFSYCSYQEMHYLMKFLYKCINFALIRYALQIINKIFEKNIVIAALKLFQAKYSQQDTQQAKKNNLHLSKSRKYILKLLKTVLIRHMEYRNLTGSTTPFALWTRFSKQVTQFTNLILSKLCQENPFSNQICHKQVLLQSIQFINEYTMALIPNHFNSLIEEILYLKIPIMLYKVRKIIDCQGIPLQHIQNGYQNHDLCLKRNLLKLWRTLSYLILKKQTKQLSDVNSKKKTNDRRIQNKLTAAHKHIRFIFQKISQTQTFLSPFMNKNNTQQKEAWDFQKDQEWIIVAFDLLRICVEKIRTYQSFQQIRRSIPQLLLIYVIPNILSKNALIQSHAISVIVTYQRQFKQISFSTSIQKNIQEILTIRNQHDHNVTKNTIFCCLPELCQNIQISKLVKKNIHIILDYFLQILQKQEFTYQLQKSLTHTIVSYGKYISQPHKYVSSMIQKVGQYCKNKYQRKVSVYIDLIRKFLKLSIIQQSYVKKFVIQIFNMSISLNQFYPDELIQDDMLNCILDQAKDTENMNQAYVEIFIAYCIYLCQKQKNFMKNSAQKVKRYDKIKRYCEGKDQFGISLGQTILNILHFFSINKRIHETSEILGYEPVIFYIHALQGCVKVYSKQQKDELLSILALILKGFIGLIQYMYECLINNEQIIGQIWSFVQMEIFHPFKNQLYKLSIEKKLQNSVQRATNVYTQDFGQQALNLHYGQISKRLVQFWCTLLYCYPDYGLLCIQQDFQLFSSAIIMFLSNPGSKYTRLDYRCRILGGIKQLLALIEDNQDLQSKILTKIVQVTDQSIKREQILDERYKKAQKGEQDDDDDENSLYQLEDYFQQDDVSRQTGKMWDFSAFMDIIEETLQDIEDKSSKFKTTHRKLIKALNKNYEGLKTYDPFNYLD